ncbi:MAG: hypothetical protein Q8N23_03495 [Archangium sp.]|nr:hypothetical protein [Archangium sp.]MDP3573227.1 hypothetical protein [Archangium sp.]
MTRWLLTGLVLIAGVPLSPTLAQRKRFAERHPMKLALKGDECLKVTAPAALGCEAPVWVCPRSWASAMCTGSYSEQAGVTFQLHAPSKEELEEQPLPMLVLEEESGDDCPECECSHDLNMALGPGLTEAQKVRELREFKKESARLHNECIREAAARQKAERVKLHCTLLMVDPCRQEAFIRCTGKNAGELTRGKTLQFSFASQPDGGAPLGGEWETPEE